MKIEFKSVEEARSILHALKRTNARNSHGDLDNILDHCENFEARLFDLINKPVETTNEQPFIIDEKDLYLLGNTLNSFIDQMSDDDEDEEENQNELKMCEKYIKKLNLYIKG